MSREADTHFKRGQRYRFNWPKIQQSQGSDEVLETIQFLYETRPQSETHELYFLDIFYSDQSPLSIFLLVTENEITEFDIPSSNKDLILSYIHEDPSGKDIRFSVKQAYEKFAEKKKLTEPKKLYPIIQLALVILSTLGILIIIIMSAIKYFQ